MSIELEAAGLLITYTDKTHERPCENKLWNCPNVAVWRIVWETRCRHAADFACEPCRADEVREQGDVPLCCAECGAINVLTGFTPAGAS